MNAPARGRLRVLYMIDRAGAFGGAERFVVGLAANMPRHRIEPWVCSTRHGNDPGVRMLADAGVPHINLGRSSKWHVHRLAGLAMLVRREGFDVLHAHKFGSNLWGTMIGRSCGVPVVIAHEHNWAYSGDPLRVWIDRHVVGRLATRFIAVSRPSGEQMVCIERIPRAKVLVMPTAYIPHAEGLSTDIRAELGLDRSVPLIGTVGGLRPEKRFDLLLDAHARLLARGHDIHLVIAGEGPCRADLERRVQQLGLDGRVHLLGHRRDIDGILRQVDVAAMSSEWEGMPLFVFECMAAAIPLVATSVGGIPDVVRDGETGLLVDPHDAAGLASAIERILADPQLGARLGAASATRLDQFTIESVARRFADLYEQLAAEARAQSPAAENVVASDQGLLRV